MSDDWAQEKRRRKRPISQDGQDVRAIFKKQRAEAGLIASLPVELLYTVLLYAKNPALTQVNRHFHQLFKSCPTTVKARYLIARWHEAYCYGFHPISSGEKREKRVKAGKISSTPSSSSTPTSIPSTPKNDLLEGGALPELIWDSPFLPVIPVNNFPYPTNNSSLRSADHFILDFCLRYPLCDYQVLCAVESIVLSSPEFGNIVHATGLWERLDGQLETYQSFFEDEGRDRYVKPSHLIVNEIPKRIFQKFDKRVKKRFDLGEKELESDGNFAALAAFDMDLASLIGRFGKGPLPLPHHLVLFFAIISLHVPTSPTGLSASNAINSYDGFALAKSTFAQSRPMVQVLLCLGAEPARKGSLALHLAISQGWLEGLQLMVEREEQQVAGWEATIRSIHRWFYVEECERRGKVPSQVEGDEKVKMASNIDYAVSFDHQRRRKSTPINAKKSRRLLDRAHLDSKMLKEAVKRKNWPVAEWIRSKGVVPDLRTIQLYDMKQASSH